MFDQTLYVTTTIPFVNAPPHVGFALELVQADAFARYQRLCGGTARLQTGTDENAFKNVLSARARGVPVETFVAQNAARFRELAELLNISFDRFVRTTDPAHHRAVATLIKQLRREDVYKDTYQGLYCTDCEDYYLERDLLDFRCPEHQRPVSSVDEQNYFFRLSAYREPLRDLIASRRLRVVPEERENEVLRFLDGGLSDISISRNATRSGGWGIPYPDDPTQVVYVWIDALVNYLSGLGYPDRHALAIWSPETTKAHLIGKNVWKFHAIYWPALLLSAGLPTPDLIVAHGFLTHEGQKISKSAGHNADPNTYIRQFGADAVRYHLLRYARPFDDTDFSVDHLARVYQSDLANGLGNLLSRLTTLRTTYAATEPYEFDQAPAPRRFREYCDAFRFDLALDTLWQEISRLNREINDARPWERRPQDYVKTRANVARWIHELQTIARYLAPFLPTTSARIHAILADGTIRRAPHLFPRYPSP